MILDFEKWHGAKNDFILLWLPDDQSLMTSLIRKAPELCSREGDGIGADGILVLTRSPHRQELLPERLTIINSDGSLAATCGNGIRCAALSVLKRHYEADERVDIPEAFELPLTQGQVVCRYLGRQDLAKKRVYWPHVSVDMGVPKIDDEHPWFEQTKDFVTAKAKEIGHNELVDDWHLVDIGNHHLVFFLDEVSAELVRKIGPALQKSSIWDGINVHLAAPLAVEDKLRQASSQQLGQAVDELYEVFVWERGAGETKACGSGACSVVKAALAGGIVEKNQWIACKMPGDILYARQGEDDEPMTLAGPGALAFWGQLEL
ncbi:MAG: diaminopimelate epimerase [Oligoflexus sp.]